MSFLQNIFGDSENKNTTAAKISWNNLTDLEQLNEIILLSNESPVLIFKHSTRCSVSRMALKQFEAESLQCNVFTQDKVTPYFLDLIAYRDISNEIATRFQVVHQSPQVLLIKKGKSVYDASHSDIDANDLAERL
jgi:bacillithiol system protein YtxJ